MNDSVDSYASIADLYHLVYSDWPASVRRQGDQLTALIADRWPHSRRVLDVACGIGTQSIALALNGFSVTGSDLSAALIHRAQREGRRWAVSAEFSVCDMRQVHATPGSEHDVVICCDNSLPHLHSDDEILAALSTMRDNLRSGGGCVISVRDYDREERGRDLFKPHGVRLDGNRRYVVYQVWDFDGGHYDWTLVFVEEHLPTQQVSTHVMHSRYYAISTIKLCEMMRQVGFVQVSRVDAVIHQPILVGTRA